jgi:hypothetical protein
MVLEKAEKHHFIFYITTILVTLLVDLFLKDIIKIKLTFVGFIIYFFLLIILTNLLLFLIYGHAIMYLLGINHKIENPITSIDILLTSSAIVATFLIPDLTNLINSFKTEFSFLLIILAIIGIYLIVYKINEKFLPFLFS